MGCREVGQGDRGIREAKTKRLEYAWRLGGRDIEETRLRGQCSWLRMLSMDSPQLGRLGRGIWIRCGQHGSHGNVVTVAQENTEQPETF